MRRKGDRVMRRGRSSGIVLALAIGGVLGLLLLSSCGATTSAPSSTAAPLPKGTASGTVPMALTVRPDASATAERGQPKTPAIRTTEQPGRVFPGAQPGATMPLSSPGTILTPAMPGTPSPPSP
ncbi:MAG: hypothetical protein AVDCRST_MAG18-3993 [uncultured Thermomicrobiales bacterium]|uniref:Uncharacterized protein n=1 Tax=uncultured Thermomicrobiales bacterium TaxID=1645740 RepID=A0A6J4VSH7_9BACT|nr:MAG: hypothetical protein AVDCRST_MAG18-3993 [uncultured Thermomicrobiales bacterium]